MPGAERVGCRIRETYKDLCSLENPWVADIARTWSWRVVWAVAQQLVELGLAKAASRVICINTRLKMLSWSEKRFADARDIPYASTSVLAQSHGPTPMLHSRNLLGGQQLRREAGELNEALAEQKESRQRSLRRYHHRKE